MKKVLSIMLSAMMVMGIMAACQSDAPASQAAESTSKAASEAVSTPAEDSSVASQPAEEPATEGAPNVDGKNIGVLIYKYDDNFMTLYRNELESYLKAGGATVNTMDGKNDQAEQTNQIQNFITQGVDVLIINLVQSSAAPQIADLCHAAGIPAVFINREPDAEEEQRWAAEGMKCTYVGADARQSGTFQGEIVAEQPEKGDINGDGEVGYVMIMGDPENVDAQYRTEFSIKALEEAGAKVNKLDEQRGDWDQARGQEIAANALTAHGDKIDVILANNDAMAMGALQAIEAAGRVVNKDIYLVGVDALPEALTALEEGRMTGTVFNDHIGQSHTAAKVAGDFIAGNAVESVNMVDYVKVTPANAAEIKSML